ncbi:ATP-binding cassette domain-containing protein [Vicingus serpentipes]|jgi:phospholipid/cholesterol/gamma-HCH transport system ATP-binding protein|uniref:ATP-binding cassette domain-containing protein n=1 Tax=Vicingus serpentipes TaxID=1926625 RepID=A0A5C6RNM6_9FLAO|nr:ATP-binding cassette domain-containing protein [Vicingus serpentipes]TXB63951.1 ATP-binding cassette domain-containing protein [Vicingus serpentipes]
MIEVKNIRKSFGEKEILKDISILFKRGEINLVIGASGSGKSVLTKCIVGLHEVDSGTISYDGREFTAMNFNQRKDIRSEIGMLFQGGALFDSLTVEENVRFPLEMYTKQSKEEMLDRVNFCLKRVNLENVNNLYPAEISGGMQKRVGIARAIALNPKYLFCDEPNSGLDPKTGIVIDNLIYDLTKEFDITTICVTHDMNSVMETGENIVFLHQGQKWWEGDKKSILKTDDEVLCDFVYSSRIMKKFKNL